ncbi:MAG TPA: dihydrolipoamide acetyltransferase family protein [Solirubrobacteraceae bacterium]|jgi:pyruvate dehydrogenase E2 component (dihydrolipoamide acetyltransferase)|nr:dihydrolipoamide acetyltransferase family protein [Solirubrobacteraceae bacterium]
MTEIVMPRLSDTMEEGTILRWLKRDGEHVERGEELVEIETDKAAMVYESDQEGLLEIVAQEGDTLPVGAPIAHVGEMASVDAESVAGAPIAHVGEPVGADAESVAGAPPNGQARSQATPASVGWTPADRPRAAAPSPSTAPSEPRSATTGEGERVKASPLARRIARESGVDLHALTGSGPGGRIVKADVQAAGAQGARGPATAPATAQVTGTPTPKAGAAPTPAAEPAALAERVATAKGETTVVELTRTQQTIARRMAESKATIPDFALHMEIDMERCVALRTELKRLSPEQAPTYNDMVVKACALALHEHPRANGSYRDGKLQLHSRVNVGVAVAVDSDDPMGGALVVPTVFDAALKSLGEIARETRALAERVRAGTITPPELGGGTFTVSNLGMYGVRSFTAIINPPQAGILSVGSLEPRAVVRDGEIVARHTMAVTLACDHRILYGADAARFLARVRELLEEPAALAL